MAFGSSAILILSLLPLLLLVALATRVAWWRLRAPTLADPAPDPLPEVTLLLPVRNEEDNAAPCLDALLLSTARPRIRVIDDASTDATVAIVERLAAQNPAIALMHSLPLPDGWTGKVHALSDGLPGVETPWILMTDADTRHHPELLARALTTALRGELDSISVSGYQEAIGLGENLLIPPAFALLDGLLGDWGQAARGDCAMANGQFLLVRREALEAIGGLTTIRNEALDDVALIAQLHGKGFRHGFFRTPSLLRIRMYCGMKAAFHGWRRIFGYFLGGRHLLVAALLLLLLLPPSLLVFALLSSDWPTAALIWLATALASGISRRSGQHALGYGLLAPIECLVLAVCLVMAWIDARRGRLASWKGRPLVLGPR